MTISISPQPYAVDAYQSVAFGSITNSYVALTNPITHSYVILDMNNTTNADLRISFDGSTGNLFLPAGAYRVYDLISDGILITPNTKVYIRYDAGAPTSGQFTLTGFYVRGQ